MTEIEGHANRHTLKDHFDARDWLNSQLADLLSVHLCENNLLHAETVDFLLCVRMCPLISSPAH